MPRSNVQAGTGLRPLDPLRDLGPLADLLEVAFADRLRAGGQHMVSDLRALRWISPLVWLLFHASAAFRAGLEGYVWVEDGRLVGNASLAPVGRSSWSIGNVAVHPDYRGRGIGRWLMEAAIDRVRAHGGMTVLLEVHADNAPAVCLYERLGFRRLDAVTDLRRPSGIAPPAPPILGGNRAPVTPPDLGAGGHLQSSDVTTMGEGLPTEFSRASVRARLRRIMNLGKQGPPRREQTWRRLSSLRSGRQECLPHNLDLRPVPWHQWRKEYELALIATPPGAWRARRPRESQFRRGLLGSLLERLAGRCTYHWAVVDPAGDFDAVIKLETHWRGARSHRLTLLVRQSRQAELAGPLVAYAMRVAASVPPADVVVRVHADPPHLVEALERHGFAVELTTCRMALELGRRVPVL